MKIFAIGMNYAAHSDELTSTLRQTGGSAVEPVVFLKADSALLRPGRPFFVPDHLGRIDYEAEVVVRISRLGKTIPERFAHRYYDALTVGVDFTARDLQRRASQAGQPWTLSKGFDGAAAIGEWVPVADVGDVAQLPFRLSRNGTTVQSGNTRDMLCSIDRLVAYLSQFFTLRTGDLLYTGTPAGVGPVSVGDHLEGWLGDLAAVRDATARGRLAERKVLDIRCR